jgi:hypothetical protein
LRCWWVESGSGAVESREWRINHCGTSCLLVLVARVENLRIEIWTKEKRDTRGGDCGWSVEGVKVQGQRLKESTIFFNFDQTCEIGLVLPILTNFEQVWPILNKFNWFQVFNPILHVIYMLTCKIVRFYELTRDFDNNVYKNKKYTCMRILGSWLKNIYIFLV